MANIKSCDACGGFKSYYAKYCKSCTNKRRVVNALANFKCSGCNLFKDSAEFTKDAARASGHASRCKPCMWEYNKNPRRLSTLHKWRLKKKYNMTPEQYQTMLVEQNYKCLGCNDVLVSRHMHTHVDHDHETGAVRGLLCRSCNQALGFARDNKTILLNLINYLDTR